ncbi:MAG: DUF6142 family protein [Lachnospiraceae bacterium]|nr:DUF6142 family protein [Lachnospiraceae bacterium]
MGIAMHIKIKKSDYIFTDKKNPRRGIMSTILGLIAAVSVALAVYLTYLAEGSAPMQYGVVVFLALIYAAAGMMLGIRALFEKDIFRLFPILGIVLNVIAMTEVGIVLYLGI